ncbi:MAG: ABC-F family ATP-binding cassette domain-containing protein [Gemmatimonadota bacterium]
MSSILDVRDLHKSHGTRTLFKGIDFSIQEGEKVGVIGRNGTGKSTLFRLLAGLEGYQRGTIALRRGTRVGLLSQDPEMDPERPIFDVAAEGKAELREALGAFHRVTGELSRDPSPDRLQALLDRQSKLSAQLDNLAGWDWGHRVERVLTKLGIEEWERPVGSLSGGERRRVALARTLLSDPDLLLLDEPTNHLDADTVLWLEETLFDFPGAALIVTHDRYFLDRVVDRMLEVGQDAFASYQGGYTEYLEERAEREARADAEEHKRRRLLEAELEWAKRSPPARTGKQKARRARAEELRRAQEKRDRTRERTVELDVGTAPRLGRTVLEFEGIAKRFGDRIILEDFSDRLRAGERIGVVGPNGVGKTTLLRIAVGEEKPDEGGLTLGSNTRIGYYDQRRELDPSLSIARAVSDTDWVEIGGRRMHLRAYLDRFLFPPHVQEQRVESLSGGERNRLLLARLFLQDFNLLVMDEPTNDLDLDTLRILEDAISAFDGCLVLVTHDRFLLDKLATALLVFEGNGRVHRHEGSWDSYLARREEETTAAEGRRREREAAERDERAARSRGERRAGRDDGPALSYRERQELDGMEGRIADLEAEREQLEARFSEPSFYQGANEEVSAVTRRFREVEAELESLFARWMELEERAG